MPPFGAGYGYDAFNNMTSRSGSYAINPSQSDSGSYTKNLRSGWTYNAEGKVTNSSDNSDSGGSSTRAWTYDAAGALSFVSEVRNGQTTTTALGYDGDGQLVIELLNGTTVDYFIRSTVLGTVLTKLKSNGGKDITYVPAHGLVAWMQLQDQPGSSPASYMIWVSHDPLGIQENKNGFLYAIDLLGNLVANAQPPVGGPPPYMPVYGATYGGLTWNSFINANNFSTGCQVDGIAKPCSQVMFGAVNGFYKPTSGSLLPFGAVIEDWKPVPPGHQPPPGSRIVGDELAFEPEYGFSGNLFPESEPQNAAFDLAGISKVADAMLSDPDCIEFAKSILDQLSGGNGGSLKDVLNAFFDQPKPHDLFTRAKPRGSLGEATALGRLKDSTATVFLATHENSQTWVDADNLVQELFHLARPGGGIYSDEQLARGLRNTPYVTDESKAFPDGTANIFDKRYNPGSPKPWSKATGYSVYFHSIAHLYCGDRNRAGIPRRNGP